VTLRVNAVLTFASYEVQDDGIIFRFTCADPGPGMESDYYVKLTDAELAATTTTPQLRTALTNKLTRKIRANGIASRLDAFIGNTITV
jgi:hypothetical protein